MVFDDGTKNADKILSRLTLVLLVMLALNGIVVVLQVRDRAWFVRMYGKIIPKL